MPLFEGAPEHIRLATPSDEEELNRFAVERHAEDGLFSLSKEKMCAFIAKAVRKDNALIVVIDGNNEIAASMALALDQWWYTDSWCLTERWLNIRPAYRNGTYADDLINLGKMLSDRWGVAFEMGVMSTFRTEAKIRLYGRKMTKVGAYFIHGLERCDGPLGREAFERSRDGE